jgi:ABC-2 type transport system ATP-binding protein
MDSAAPHAAAVRATGVCKAYRGKAVLSDVDLVVPRGERFCIVGRNGSGKSTLLEIIMGLRRATSGTIEVLGRHPLDQTLRRHCAMLMDRPVFPYYAKIKEIVWLYGKFYERPLNGTALLKTFDLDPEKYVRHLSKGQIQRLGMLLVVLGRPQLMLLDEPSSGLDPQGRVLLWDTLGRASSDDSTRTLMLATHDLIEAERWADRIGVLHQGRLIAADTPARLCQQAIGATRKLTIVGDQVRALYERDGFGAWPTAFIGRELAIYADDPEAMLTRLALSDRTLQFRIENVSLRDAYFKLTGEVPDDAPTLAA